MLEGVTKSTWKKTIDWFSHKESLDHRLSQHRIIIKSQGSEKIIFPCDCPYQHIPQN